jgi:hypothetical protein
MKTNDSGQNSPKQKEKTERHNHINEMTFNLQTLQVNCIYYTSRVARILTKI